MTKAVPKKVVSDLKDFLNSQLPLNAKNDFKDEVMKQCKITESTYYLRLKNTSLFSPLEKKFIADLLKVSQKKIF